jgi:hypothetical protein
MTKRFYSGARDTGAKKMGEAARLKRLEIELGGKLPISNEERYKRILKKRLEENHSKAASQKSTFQLPGTKPVERKMSKKAEQALSQIAQRKAAKEEKALRQMVIVQPRVFSDAGRIDSKGNAYDLGNNLTLKVDVKTGKIKTNTGWTVGKYKTKKKLLTNALLTDALKKHGAYFIQQKRLQMLLEQQRLAALGMEGSNVHGTPLASEIFMEKHYGSADGHGNSSQPSDMNQRTGANMTAWGAMSNNAHGTFSENAWGGMMDNVWGGVNNNVWGGIGGNGWGGHRGFKIWGTGAPNQKNYLKPLGALFIGLFGFGFGMGKGAHKLRGGRSGGGSTPARAGRSR